MSSVDDQSVKHRVFDLAADRAHSRPRPVVVGRDTAPVVGPQNQQLIPMVHRGVADWCQGSSYAVTMKPGHLAALHVHDDTEVQVVCLNTIAATISCNADGSDVHVIVSIPGEIVVIPPGRAHTALNLDFEETLHAVEFRPRDPYCNRDVRPLPELQFIAEALVPDLRHQHAKRLLRLKLAGMLPW